MCRSVRGPPKRAAAAAKAPNYMLMPHSTLSSSGASLRVCIFARICGQACDMSKTHKVTKATQLGGQKGPWKVVRGKCGKQREEEDPVKILQRSKRGGGNIHSYLSPFLPPSFTSHFLRFLSLSPSPGSQYANVLPLSLRHRGPPPIPHFPLPRQSIYSDEPIINPSPLLQWWLLDK